MTAPVPGLDRPFPLGGLGGSLAASVTASGTTLQSPDFAQLPSDPSPSRPLPLLLTDGTNAEIVHVTAHDAGAVTATVLRGRDGTTARAWIGPPPVTTGGTAWYAGLPGGVNGYATLPATPAGLVARHRRTSNTAAITSTSASAAVGVARLAAPVRAGRLYRVRADGILLSGAAAQLAAVQLTHTLDGSTPTVTSALIEAGYVFTPSSAASLSVTWALVGLVAPTADATLAVLLSAWRQNGSSSITVQGNTNSPLDLSIEDLGLDPGSTGTTL